MLISLISAKGSPGSTTAALAVASRWPRTAVVVDADTWGGDMAAGVGRGSWPPRANLVDLVVETRSSDVAVALPHHVFRPAPHCPPVLAGLGSVEQAEVLPWDRLAAGFARVGAADVLADCGRFHLGTPVRPLLQRSDHVVVVTRSSLPAVRATARLAPLLQVRLVGGGIWLLVVRPGLPYDSAEIAEAVRLPLLGELADDARAASVWSDGAPPPRGFHRSALQRDAAGIAALLAARHPESASPPRERALR